MSKSSKMNLKLLSIGLGFLIAGCQPQSKSETQAVNQKTSVLSKPLVAGGVLVSGPQVVMANVGQIFGLDIPAGVTVTEALWNFGDGTVLQTGLDSLEHIYAEPGAYAIQVQVTLESGERGVLRHDLQAVETNDARLCVNDLKIIGPIDIKEKEAANFSVNLPQCLSYIVQRVDWSFGDESSKQNGLSVQHTFSGSGDYRILAQIILRDSDLPYATLYLQTSVAAGTLPPAEPTHQCPTSGLSRQIPGAELTEDKTCGLNGHQTDTYREQITETCSFVGESLQWMESGRKKELVSEGTCQKQSCETVDPSSGLKSLIADGESRTFYASLTPTGNCASVQTSRTCQNGVLSGEASYQFKTCFSGCGAFGAHGTERLSVTIGQESVDRVCKFQEPGILDMFTVVADQVCKDGIVITGNARRGGLIKEGLCPTYSWVASDQFSACSAECGGQQTQIFSCQDSLGASAASERCALSAPVVTRICDGDPEAVRRQDTTAVMEEAGQSKICPSNKVGVVLQKRQISTVTNFACVNHKVQAVSQNVIQGPWVSEELCRDFGTRRCAEDSLDVAQARERYRWMLKCAPQVKAIQEFMEEFKADEHASLRRRSLKYGKEDVYASFVQRSTGKPWLAPKKESAACNVPSDIYVSTVCSADCATPEETILSQADHVHKMGYTSFVEAWQKDFQFVAGLPDGSSLSTRRVARVPVERWVTQEVEGEHDVIEFRLLSGRFLKVTPHHHLVTSDGYLKTAEDFKVGESLVQLGGTLDPIVSMTPIKHFGKVYNLYVKSSSPHRNIISTEGYLNGTAYFQSEGVKHLNKVLVRRSLLHGAF